MHAGILTTVLAFGLSASYVALAYRRMDGYGFFGTIWLRACYRAGVSYNFLLPTTRIPGRQALDWNVSKHC